MGNNPRLLVVDDERTALANMEHILRKAGHDVVGAKSGPDALELIRREEFDVVVTDLRMEKVDGMRILEECKHLHPLTEVIMITGYASVESAIEAMKLGAYHYIPKPYRVAEVRRIVAEALEKVRLKRENQKLKQDLQALQQSKQVRIVTRNPEMLAVLDTARKAAAADCSMLILGASGTGKELLARFIHENSRRSKGPLLAINCGAFSEELLANELFGHEKGAFTGAGSSKPGIIEAANGGTLFLDEVTEMSGGMQTKLLRALQERQIMRVGSTRVLDVDVRFLAATNREVHEAVETGAFRRDLYYRLNVVSLEIPPLLRRKDDIPLLCRHFLIKHSNSPEVEAPSLADEVLEILLDHDFPGNVRELENIIERGIALASDGVIRPVHLPDELRRREMIPVGDGTVRWPSLEETEVKYIKRILEETGGNRTLASSILGIDRSSLWRKIKKYELDDENPPTED